MLRTINLGTINPFNLDEKAKSILRAFLNESGKPPFIKRYQTYTMLIPDPADNQLVIYSFQLTHSILTRERKENKSGQRHEIIENDITLGSGGFGIVLKSAGVLTNSSPNFFKAKPRAIKQQAYTSSVTEYERSKEIEHLHMKPPVKVSLTQHHETSYLTMRYLPGLNLYQIIMKEENGSLSLNNDTRIKLSLAILRAIQTQAHRYNRVHRDIKAENIMVDPHDCSVYLIDYFFSKDLNNPNDKPEPNATMVTQPLEQFIHCEEDIPRFSLKTDSYAAGKTLAELWQAEAEVNLTEYSINRKTEYFKYFQYAKNDTKFSYDNSQCNHLSKPHAIKLKNMLEQMTRALPDDRWSLEQAIKTLEEIQQERCTPIASPPATLRV